MCDDPGATKQITPVSPKLTSDRSSMDRTHEKLNSGGDEVEDIEERLPDLSKMAGMASDGLSSLKSISFSQIVNQIWHFFTVDYGQKCMAILPALEACNCLCLLIRCCLQILALVIILFMLFQVTISGTSLGYRMERGFGHGSFYVTTVNHPPSCCKANRYMYRSSRLTSSQELLYLYKRTHSPTQIKSPL